jgi:catechol 2,3-dioxygenase-like lactoylglutathione lyase family enzyme
MAAPFSRKLIQVGVVIRDMERVVRDFQSFGIGPFIDTRLHLPPMTGSFQGKPSTSEEKLLSAMMGDVELELFEPVSGDSPWKQFLDNRGEGIHHVAFAPEDLDKDIAAFTDKGAKIMHDAKWEGGGGAYLDTGIAGLILEFYQEGEGLSGKKPKREIATKPPFSNRLIHLGILVRDLEKATRRLESFGIGPFKPFDPDSLPPFIGQPEYVGKPMDDTGCDVSIAKVGDLEFEMFEPHKAGTPWKDYLDKYGEGIHHIAFRSYDMENEKARLTKQGAGVVFYAKWQGGGSVYLDLGGGLIVELEQK